MSEFQDPPRLFDLPGTPEALKSGLQEACRDGLGEDAVARVSAGVMADLGAGGSSGPALTEGAASSAAGSSAAGGLAVKIAAGVVVVGVLAGGGWLVTRSDVPREPASAHATTVEEIPPVVSVQRARELAPDPSATVEAEAAKSSAKHPPAEVTLSASTLAEEHRLLRAARGALSTDPKRALALAREHGRRFPKGVLAQEREVITIQALAAMGQDDAAREKAEGFDKQYPGSPHRHRVDEVTGVEKKDSPGP